MTGTQESLFILVPRTARPQGGATLARARTDVLDQLSPTAGYYVPSPTCAKFIRATRHGPLDEMRVLILRGARGEGKTSGGLWACMALAERLLDAQQRGLWQQPGAYREALENLLLDCEEDG